MNSRSLITATTAIAAFAAATAYAQNAVSTSGQTGNAQRMSNTRVFGTRDADVAVPALVLPLGRKDAVALEAILDFLKAVNGGSWSGMQATGILTGPDGKATSQATFTVRGGENFRLDVNAPEGERSIRIHGPSGRIQESDGKRHILPPVTASIGLVAFPKLLASSFPGNQTAVLDRGCVSIEGRMLRRVTIEEPLDAAEKSTSPYRIGVTDLYFDPATHLLVKSVGSVQVDSADRALYVQAISYGDYQTIDGVLLPQSLRQTLNGQLQWSLQLTNARLDSAVASSYFKF
jgi:hypothetical protein